MKTLIFNGSPRINVDTGSLIKKITEKIPGEYRIVNARAHTKEQLTIKGKEL